MTSQLISGKEIDMTFQKGDIVKPVKDDADELQGLIWGGKFDAYLRRGLGEVIEETPYKVHVRWSDGQYLCHGHHHVQKVQ